MARKRTTKPPEIVVAPPVSTEQDNLFDITVRVKLFGKSDQVRQEVRSAFGDLKLRLPSVEIRTVRQLPPTAKLLDQDQAVNE